MTDKMYLLSMPNASQTQVNDVADIVEEVSERRDVGGDVVIVGEELHPMDDGRLEELVRNVVQEELQKVQRSMEKLDQ